MKLGVIYPSTEYSTDTDAVKEFAQAVDGAGFDQLVLYDHVLGADPTDRGKPWERPYTYRDPFREPFTFMAYLAGITERIEFVTNVMVLPQRQTALVAKQAAEVSLLSRGRIQLGIGVGKNEVEYESLDVDFATRGARMDEQIEVMRLLWSEEVIDYHGRFHSIPRAGISPRPTSGSVPIWVGGAADVALRRAARVGDGWLLWGTTRPDEPIVRASLARVRSLVEEHGRSVDDFGLHAHVMVEDGIDRAVANLHAWRELGVTHASIKTMWADLPSDEAHLDAALTIRERYLNG
jgi:probable F420-dependent oxidoreductase